MHLLGVVEALENGRVRQCAIFDVHEEFLNASLLRIADFHGTLLSE